MTPSKEVKNVSTMVSTSTTRKGENRTGEGTDANKNDFDGEQKRSYVKGFSNVAREIKRVIRPSRNTERRPTYHDRGGLDLKRSLS